MSLENRIIVSGRLESGDTVDVTMKVKNREYSQEDLTKLRADVEKKLVPCESDTLYYQVRTWSGNGGRKRRNWSRIKTLGELIEVISDVMGNEEVPA